MVDFKVGDVVGNFEIVRFYRKRDRHGSLRKRYEVKCKDCENHKDVAKQFFVKRKINYCVCGHEGKYQKKHGMYGNNEHIAWRSMIQRCYDESCSSYSAYGGRGISVCDEWRESFQAFYDDMGKKPKGMSLDRIDPLKGYCKENCRWATASNQAHNKRALTDGFKGVTWYFGKYISRIMIDGKSLRIGLFGCPIEAAIEYDKKAREIRGDHARTNADLGKFTDDGIKKSLKFYR